MHINALITTGIAIMFTWIFVPIIMLLCFLWKPNWQRRFLMWINEEDEEADNEEIDENGNGDGAIEVEVEV